MCDCGVKVHIRKCAAHACNRKHGNVAAECESCTQHGKRAHTAARYSCCAERLRQDALRAKQAEKSNLACNGSRGDKIPAGQAAAESSHERGMVDKRNDNYKLPAILLVEQVSVDSHLHEQRARSLERCISRRSCQILRRKCGFNGR